MGDPRRARIASCLADLHERQGRGERVELEHYRTELGALYPEFERVVAEETAIDNARSAPVAALPRAFGPFTLLRELGRGGSGVVYEAVQRHLGRRIALKIMRTGFDTNVKARERFAREARACARVCHDHIVEIFEAGVQEDRPYYAMTLLEGKSLAELVEDGEVPEPRTLAAGMADVADAIQTMHHRGVVHRDVKPSNIMVDPSGRFVLADFGLARTTQGASLTQSGDTLGTPHYMSPEQMLGRRREVDGRTDVYGLGAALYEATTGHTPFETDDLPSLLRMVLSERPPSPRRLAPELPRELERIVLKCLEKRPEDRYQTAASLERDLRSFAAGEQVEGRPVSRARHEARRMVSTPRRIAVAALVLVLAGAVAWLLATGNGTKVRVEATNVADATPVVSINGGAAVRHGATVDVEPGPVRVRLSADGYLPFEGELEATEGETTQLRVPLVKEDWLTSGASQADLYASFGVPRTSIDDESGTRGRARPDTPPVLRSPRGRVRLQDIVLEDLGRPGFELEVPVDFSGASTLRFVVNDTLLAEAAVPEPDGFAAVHPLPDDVVAALVPGTKVEMVLVQAGQLRAAGTFEVVGDEDLSDRFKTAWAALQDLGRRGAGHDAVREVLELDLLVSEGLYMAALRRADRLEAGHRAGLRTLLLHRDALRKALGAGATHTRVHTRLVNRIRDPDAFSDAERVAAYAD